MHALPEFDCDFFTLKNKNHTDFTYTLKNTTLLMSLCLLFTLIPVKCLTCLNP